jgi:hypothetical protein
VIITANSPQRPFRDRVDEIRRMRKLSYVDLEERGYRARSTAWFNTLVNQSRWRAGPPADDTIDDLASL